MRLEGWGEGYFLTVERLRCPDRSERTEDLLGTVALADLIVAADLKHGGTGGTDSPFRAEYSFLNALKVGSQSVVSCTGGDKVRYTLSSGVASGVLLYRLHNRLGVVGSNEFVVMAMKPGA